MRKRFVLTEESIAPLDRHETPVGVLSGFCARGPKTVNATIAMAVPECVGWGGTH
jgi:hypothetical protein